MPSPSDNRSTLPFRPWFGAWPPIPKGGAMDAAETKREERKRIRDLLTFWGFVLAALIVGALLMHYGNPLFQHIGTALFIAGFLAGTVDVWLKRDLARNAVEAAIGYLLPKEIQPELQWIHRQQVYWVDWKLRLELLPKESHVLVKVTLHRDLINRGAGTE